MRYLIWFFILLLFQTCSPPKVIKFLNDNLDYSNYQTYRLIHYKSDDKSFSADGMAFYTDVEKAIEQNMVTKGYKHADRPDLIARYEIISTTVTESNTRNYDPYGYNTYYVPQNAQKHTEGIVLIELRDRKQKKLVWQGSIDLRYKMRKEVNLTVLQAINHIFESYPYQAGSNERIISEK